MENWKIIPTNPDYEASDRGRIRRAETGYVLKQRVDAKGYASIGLRGNGTTLTRRVHRLVCAAFHGRPPTEKHQVAHADCDKLNNVPSNLRWATAKENVADTIRMGRRNTPKGEESVLARLSDEDVRFIRSAKRRHGIMKQLSDRFGVSVGYIGALRNRGFKVKGRPIWPHIPFPD